MRRNLTRLALFLVALRVGWAQIFATTSIIIGSNPGFDTTTEYYYICPRTDVPIPTKTSLATLDIYKTFTTIYTTTFLAICSTGLTLQAYTITEKCPCGGIGSPGYVPSDFTTTVVPCSVCGPGTLTLELTTPVAGRVMGGTVSSLISGPRPGGQSLGVGQNGNTLSSTTPLPMTTKMPKATGPATFVSDASRIGFYIYLLTTALIGSVACVLL